MSNNNEALAEQLATKHYKAMCTKELGHLSTIDTIASAIREAFSSRPEGAVAQSGFVQVKPTVPGAYWLKGNWINSPSRTDLVRIELIDDVLCVVSPHDPDEHKSDLSEYSDDFFWSGPLSAPAAAEGVPAGWEMSYHGLTLMQTLSLPTYVTDKRRMENLVGVGAVAVPRYAAPVAADESLISEIVMALQQARRALARASEMDKAFDADYHACDRLIRRAAALTARKADGKGGEA